MQGRVLIGTSELNPRRSQQEVADHTLEPGYFGWGYGGTGPMQLAAAILLEVAPRDEATKLHLKFSEEVIEELPFGQKFTLGVTEVEKWLRRNGGHPLKDIKR